MQKIKKWKSAFRYVNYTLSLRSPRLKKTGACVKKLFRFRREFRWKIESKSVRTATPNGNGTKNQRKSHATPSPNALFRPRVRFLAILGPQMGAKNHEKCVRKRVRKNGWKKNTKMRWVGVMRWASGRGGRDALACINPPGYAEDRKFSAKRSAHRGPEGAVDFNSYGSCRPPPIQIWYLKFEIGDLKSEIGGL